MKKIILLLVMFSQLALSNAAQAFVVKQIEVEGVQRISPATVESYVDVKRGQSLSSAKSAQIIRDLYKTGFFDRVTLFTKNNTLIVRLVERPTIGQLSISGNSVIPTDKLKSVMKSLGISEGRTYNPVTLERIKQSLISQYYQMGRYNARVDVSTTPMSRQRVSVAINISEGLVAKIARINISGNKTFDESTLIKQLNITTSGILTFFTQTDRYSEARLDESLEGLRSFYLNHGYIKFDVKSAQAEVTPDRKSVYINIVIDEGEQYIIKRSELEGDLLGQREEVEKLITIRPGEPFSRQKLIETQKAISTFYGNRGYMYTAVAIQPQIDDKKHEIVLVFNVKPGKKIYVRNVTFSDNTRTNDVVLRREIEQMEAAPIQITNLQQSKQRLSLLPYIKQVDMSVRPVPDSDEQVDVNYKIKEDNSAQASLKLGYIDTYKFILGASLNQNNFLGTGNTLGINGSVSKYEKFFGIDYTNPYYTQDGISRTFNFAISQVNPKAISGLNSGYTSNQYSLGVLYGIPIGQEIGAFNRVMLGASYQNTLIKLNSDPTKVSNQINSFVNKHGRRYQEIDLKMGYSRDSRDKALFPTRGVFQTLFLDVYLPAWKNSLSYYTLNYHGLWYTPLNDKFIILARGDFGYGNSLNGGGQNFPFFNNYYAGGIGSVRGFLDYSLGARDSNGQAFGGNVLVDGSIGLIFPNYISDNMRTIIFFDAGNVFTTYDNTVFGGQSANPGPLRYSFGIGLDWVTPFGPIELSLAKPILRSHDSSKAFQFALGTNF